MPDQDTVASLCVDLAAEHDALDEVVAGLDAAGWDRPTPAEGWRVRDQIGHLTFFDRMGALAVTDPAAFELHRVTALDDPEAFGEESGRLGRELTGAALLAAWRKGRRGVLDAFASLDPASRVPWYGPPMSPMSFVSARLMETWAHGQDVVDTLGAARPATARLRHVAHIGVRARPWSYVVHGLPAPAGDVAVVLDPPDGGARWSWGDPEQSEGNRVSGPALDFCLVVTQRRHPADTRLVVEGPLAVEWIGIAQAFAGPPGTGRQPGEFPIADGDTDG